MSRKPDDLDLEYIRELAKSSTEIQDLIQAKHKEQIDLDRTQSVSYKKLDPEPSPLGDKRHLKVYRQETISRDFLEQKTVENQDRFDRQVKEKMDNLVEHLNHEPIRSKVHNMDEKDLSILVEKGVGEFKAKQEKDLERALEFDLDNPDNNFEDYSVYDDFLDNSKSLEIDNKPSPADDFE